MSPTNVSNQISATARFTLACVVAFAVSGCGHNVTRRPLPAALYGRARALNATAIRSRGDKPNKEMLQDFVAGMRKLGEDPGRYIDHNGNVSILVLSAGAGDGAFGAGFLCGWTASGKRPTPVLVTGVSVGAMIAPLAFLGPEYDEKLKKVFTTMSEKDFYEQRSAWAIITGTDSVVDNTPMVRLIEQYVGPRELEGIAREHRLGRRLYIATTNLDARGVVIWNIGAIASSGSPEALKLVRTVLLASSSVPVVFPPVYVKVTVDGEAYDEMHVDGGVLAHMFYRAFMFTIKDVLKAAGRTETKYPVNLYVIRSGQVKHHYQEIKDPSLESIGEALVASIIRAQGLGDIFRMYLLAQQDGINFRLAFIPSDFKPGTKRQFDSAVMRRLFRRGYDSAKAGYRWHKTPPGFDPKWNQAR